MSLLRESSARQWQYSGETLLWENSKGLDELNLLTKTLADFTVRFVLASWRPLLLSFRSFFELMLFFSKEEFLEEPLKDILDSFQVTQNWTKLLFFKIHTTPALNVLKLLKAL